MPDASFLPDSIEPKSMKLSFALLTAIGVAGLAQFASAADITGTVTLNGTPPAEREITPLNNDAVCGKLHPGKVSTEFYVVGADKGLADVIVMLKGVPAKAADASAAPAVINQKGCLYVPQIVAIQAGQKLVVKNSDPRLCRCTTFASTPQCRRMWMLPMAKSACRKCRAQRI